MVTLPTMGAARGARSEFATVRVVRDRMVWMCRSVREYGYGSRDTDRDEEPHDCYCSGFELKID
jgi:hypothetical protein